MAKGQVKKGLAKAEIIRTLTAMETGQIIEFRSYSFKFRFIKEDGYFYQYPQIGTEKTGKKYLADEFGHCDETTLWVFENETELKEHYLKERWEMACHNLLCYSKNYTMHQPKEGYEEEWKEAREEVKKLETELADLRKGEETASLPIPIPEDLKWEEEAIALPLPPLPTEEEDSYIPEEGKGFLEEGDHSAVVQGQGLDYSTECLFEDEEEEAGRPLSYDQWLKATYGKKGEIAEGTFAIEQRLAVEYFEYDYDEDIESLGIRAYNDLVMEYREYCEGMGWTMDMYGNLSKKETPAPAETEDLEEEEDWYVVETGTGKKSSPLPCLWNAVVAAQTSIPSPIKEEERPRLIYLGRELVALVDTDLSLAWKEDHWSRLYETIKKEMEGDSLFGGGEKK